MGETPLLAILCFMLCVKIIGSDLDPILKCGKRIFRFRHYVEKWEADKNITSLYCELSPTFKRQYVW